MKERMVERNVTTPDPRPPRSPRAGAAVLALAALAAASAASARPAAAEEVNRIVLRVNDRIATLLDYETRRDAFLREAQRRNLSPEEHRRVVQEAPEQVFRELFEELLLQSRADQLSVTVSEERVADTIERMKQANGITTDEEFRQALATSGMTEEELRQQMRRNFRMRQVMEQEVQERVTVSEEDLRRIYGRDPDRFRLPEQRRLREVVVLEASGRPLEERQRIAREVREELAKGEAESALVSGHAAEQATSGIIDLGWVSPGDLASALETAAWQLAPGAVSAPVEGRGGLHVLHLLEVREPRVQTFNEVQEVIRREEEDRVYRDEVAEYLVELQRDSYIVAKPPAEAAGFRRLLGTGLPEEVLEGGAATPPAGEGVAVPAPESPASPAPSPTEDLEPGDPGQLPVPKPVDPQPPVDEPPTPRSVNRS
jgi:peptidyl-prolyl cis-trans isomerase SurA